MYQGPAHPRLSNHIREKPNFSVFAVVSEAAQCTEVRSSVTPRAGPLKSGGAPATAPLPRTGRRATGETSWGRGEEGGVTLGFYRHRRRQPRRIDSSFSAGDPGSVGPLHTRRDDARGSRLATAAAQHPRLTARRKLSSPTKNISITDAQGSGTVGSRRAGSPPSHCRGPVSRDNPDRCPGAEETSKGPEGRGPKGTGSASQAGEGVLTSGPRGPLVERCATTNVLREERRSGEDDRDSPSDKTQGHRGRYGERPPPSPRP